MKRLLPVVAVVAALAATTAPSGAQAPETPKGTSSEGARFTLVGQVVTIVLPAALRPGRVLRAECGWSTVQDGSVGSGRAIGRGLRTVRVRLRGDAAAAEWCEYSHAGGERRGAAAMHPGARAFEPLAPGPGVREAIAGGRGGGGRFLQRGSLVTVEMNEPFKRSVVAGVGCGSRRGEAGFRRVAVAAGQRVIAVDTEKDLASATWCLLEAPGGVDHLEATLP